MHMHALSHNIINGGLDPKIILYMHGCAIISLSHTTLSYINYLCVTLRCLLHVHSCMKVMNVMVKMMGAVKTIPEMPFFLLRTQFSLQIQFAEFPTNKYNENYYQTQR